MTRRPYSPGRKRPKPQRERLLDYLRAAGLRGLTQSELLRPPDSRPILRVASRVHELRQLGHRIETRGRRDNQVVYVLVRESQPPPRVRPKPWGSSLAPGERPATAAEEACIARLVERWGEEDER